MKKYIILLIIIAFILVFLYNYNDTENYVSYPYLYNTGYDYDKRYCKNCKEKSILDCGVCNNCGICVKDNIAKCADGDIDGPTDEVCDKWIYGNVPNYRTYYPYYYNYYYPFYYDMFYPPYYYNRISNPTYSYPHREFRVIKNRNRNKYHDRKYKRDRKRK